MTVEQANIKAKERWGDSAFACLTPGLGYGVYKGIGADGISIYGGCGSTFEQAFIDADYQDEQLKRQEAKDLIAHNRTYYEIYPVDAQIFGGHYSSDRLAINYKSSWTTVDDAEKAVVAIKEKWYSLRDTELVIYKVELSYKKVEK